MAERQDLETRLANQLDDSLKIKVVSFGGIRKTLIRPAVFDTNYANRSVVFMNALMISLGYYQARIQWDSSLKRIGKQQRVTIDFEVTLGKNLKLDSVGYELADTALQQLTLKNRKASLLVKAKPYSQQQVSAELDRLIELYKNNGYYKITKEDIYAEVDTVLAGLINPGLDPFEQIRLLNELKNKRDNPTINVIIKQRTKAGSGHLKQYHIGEINIYPNLQLFDDSTRKSFDSSSVRGITVFSTDNKFKSPFLRRNSSLVPGTLYRQRDYFKTINTFSQLGAWQQVNVELYSNDSLGLVNANLNLYPQKKLGIGVDLEVTRNSGDVLATGNLFGVGLNLGVRNRNFARESIQSNTNIRGGIELGTQNHACSNLAGKLLTKCIFPQIYSPL